MKITKELFDSFEGLKELKRMKEQRCCSGINCQICPLDKHNVDDDLECRDIIDLDRYDANDAREMKRMNKVINIFTKENISENLSLIDKRLKYNSKVIYNGNTHKIKGVLKKEFIRNNGSPILLNGFSNDYEPVCDDSICVIKEADTKKEYSLWVNVQDIEII